MKQKSPFWINEQEIKYMTKTANKTKEASNHKGEKLNKKQKISSQWRILIKRKHTKEKAKKVHESWIHLNKKSTVLIKNGFYYEQRE